MQKITDFIARFPLWISLFAGGLSALGFAPWHVWPLTLACFALLIHLIANAPGKWRAFLTGWLFGVGHFTIGNQWIAVAFTYQAAMPVSLGYGAVFGLSLYLAVYPAAATFGAWWIARRAGGIGVSLPLVLAFAGLWTVTEWLRSWVFTGFAWNPLAAAWLEQTYGPPLLPWIGTYGSSGFLILIIGWTVWLMIGTAKHLSRLHSGPARFAAWCIGMMIVTSATNSLDSYVGSGAGSTRTRITIVQPNISQIDKYLQGYEDINFSKLARQSQRLPEYPPRLIFWPEAAIPDYLDEGYPFRYYQFQPGETAAGARARLMTLMREGDMLILGSNRLVIEDGQLVAARNSISAMDANGKLLGHYDKSHLVPYGEYLPMPWLLRPLGLARLVPGDLDFWPGPGPQTLKLPFNGKSVNVGLQICYEIIFSGQVVDRKHRPDFIFNPSNDAWFGTIGPPQHLAQARLRAIEEGLPVIRSTPTGISAVIDADGRIVRHLGMGRAGRIDTFVPMAKQPTLFARYGNILPLAFAALLIAFALLPLARRRASV